MSTVDEEAKRLNDEVAGFHKRISAAVDVRRASVNAVLERESEAFETHLAALSPEAMGFVFRQECPMFGSGGGVVTKLQAAVRDEVERRLRGALKPKEGEQ